MTGPTSIGIIMDGNRRFAKEKGIPALAGHKAGYEKLKEVTRWAKEAGIKNVIAYTFSTENWKREKEEVGYLMDLIRFAIEHEFEELKKENVRIRFIGDLSRLPEDIQKGIADLEDKTKDGELSLVLALSYGGRSEIISAIKKASKAEKIDELTEENFGNFLETHTIPDPDLVIRTSGEQRISNFLLWQIAYSELFFSKTYWPAFSKEEFFGILADFSSRDRRKGK